MSQQPEKITILGGGLSSLTTAYYLTSEPDWRTKYDITLYHLGHRLGGKGASGRNPDFADRIEEHGLHIWFGFYDNAFRMMRSIYDELNQDLRTPLARFEEAFKPASFFVLEELLGKAWDSWPIKVPQNSLRPGIDFTQWTLKDYLQFMLDMAINFYSSSDLGSTGPVEPQHQGWLAVFADVLKDAGQLAQDFEGKLLLSSLHLVEKMEGSAHPKILEALRLFLDRMWKRVEAKIANDETNRRLWIMIELFTVNAIGILADDLQKKGFESIDIYDYREWLTRHGASDLCVNSAPVQAIYGLVFCGRDLYSFAAGTALKGTLRFMFDFKGAIAYRMQAGMGDVIMMPLYKVLKKRGVKIRFFHKVQNLAVGTLEGQPSISSVRITRQVTLKNDYQPFVSVRGLDCWPTYPLYDQIVEGETLKKNKIDLEDYWSAWLGIETFDLRQGVDYDRLVLGISIGAFQYLTPELIEASPEWKAMVTGIQTTMTDALQLWTYPDVAGAGWNYWKEKAAILGCFVVPFDTWSDMSHLLIRENWPGNLSPNQIAYFCGAIQDPSVIPPLTDHGYPQRQLDQAIKVAVDYLENDLPVLWPQTTDASGKFNWNLLVDASNAEGAKRIASQFIRVNVQPTERYVLSAKGTTSLRLKEDGSIFKNLVLTGDWITNAVLNAGCVESTVASGIQAANVFLSTKVEIKGS